ncbi:pentapeptide repeat-containing protein [Actinomadura macra]|uniref:pentapeptide repeat-containing protein n=1 Tax=Actinomadura macra TaxID=46164 RepID=UPI00082BB323|nr:pentapeptide repeat-containing protein [Actinomadura macra]
MGKRRDRRRRSARPTPVPSEAGAEESPEPFEPSSRLEFGAVILVNIVTALAAIGASAVAYLGVDASRAELDQNRREQEVEAYDKGLAHLQANSDVTQRVSGVLELTNLASRSSDRRKIILSLLCQHVLARAPAAGKAAGAPDEDVKAAVRALGALPFAPDTDQRDLEGDRLPVVDLSRTRLPGIDLGFTHFDGARFAGAVLTGTDLHRASLRGADFTGASLARANLNVAILYNATFVRAHLEHADLNGAQMHEAVLGDAHLTGADLGGARLDGAGLQNARLTGTKLEGAWLGDAHIANADLRGAHLSGATLTGADLSGADLAGADLTQTKIGGTDLSRARNLTLGQLHKTVGSTKATRLPPGFGWTGSKIIKVKE